MNDQSPTTIERRSISARELRVQQDGQRKRISGYAAVFNSPSVDLGGFVEIIAPGAFSATLSAADSDVLALRDHDQTILLGRTKAGTLNLREDAIGLFFTCTLPNTTQAADLAESIGRGDLDSVSFGFICPDGGDAWSHTSDGQLVRTLNRVDLLEISPCSWAAYPATTVALRSCPPNLRAAHVQEADKLTGDQVAWLNARLKLAQLRAS